MSRVPTFSCHPGPLLERSQISGSYPWRGLPAASERVRVNLVNHCWRGQAVSTALSQRWRWREEGALSPSRLLRSLGNLRPDPAPRW